MRILLPLRWLQSFKVDPTDLLRDRTYRRLWTSILISSFGGQVTLLRATGLEAGDHISIFMENNARMLEIEGAAEGQSGDVREVVGTGR